jgi:hypothetical protein
MKIFVALTVFAACLTLPAAPASAAYPEDPDRIEGTSPLNSWPLKFAQAQCPPGQVVIGMGGQVNFGNGGVALTGIVPDEDLSTVTAWGRELPGHDKDWSVTAVALCHQPGTDAPKRISSEPEQYLAQARCPFGKILYSIGYHIQAPGGGEFIREATSSDDFRDVTVRADGPAVDPENLVAYGICAPPLRMRDLTRSEPGGFDSSSPKEAIAGLPESYHFSLGSWMFGAGAAVRGASGVLIDALVPTSGLDGAYARAYKASPGVAAVEDGGDWELQAYGNYVGEWY